MSDTTISDTQTPDIDIQEVIAQVGEIAQQLPDMINNTVSVSIISSYVPENGIEIADVARMGFNQYLMATDDPTISQRMGKMGQTLNEMSDADIINVVQDHLEAKGLTELSENIADGNLSKSDLISGLSELGHAMNGQDGIDADVAAQVRDAMGQDVTDPTLLEGLVLAEQHIDRVLTEVATSMAEQYDAGFVGQFDNKASSTVATPESAIPSDIGATITNENPDPIKPM